MRRGHRPRRQLAPLSIRWATAREPCLHPKGWCPLRAQWHGERSASLESLAVRVARDLRRAIACLRLPEPPDLSVPASRLHSVVSGARELALLWGMISGTCARLPVSVAPLLESAPPSSATLWILAAPELLACTSAGRPPAPIGRSRGAGQSHRFGCFRGRNPAGASNGAPREQLLPWKSARASGQPSGHEQGS